MRVFNQTPFLWAPVLQKVSPDRPRLTIVVKASFSFKPGEPLEPLSEQMPFCGDLYVDDDLTKECLQENDLAPHKPRADVFFLGACHAPGGRPVTVCNATLQVGALSKTIAVIGHRVWKGLIFTKQTQPEPFTMMPLRYAQSFGGADWKRNPVGKGHGDKQLPNLEDPKNLIHSSGDTPEPIGFGPVSRFWPQRASKLGTYDKKWLQERWPCLAEDFDWTYFNAAPEDQQVEDYLIGDETLRLVNLHPEHQTIEAKLPELRIRCFLNETTDAGMKLRELSMNLDTLTLDAERNRVSLVWRGVREVRTEDAAEIRDLLIVSTPLNIKPQPAQEFQALLDEAVRAAELPPDESQVRVKEEGTAPAPPSRAELQRLIAARGPFRDADLSRADLSNLDLSGLDLRECMLEGASLAGATLVGTILTGALLSGANLSRARLSSANLVLADLTGADLSAADLTFADLSGATAIRATLKGADLSNGRADLAIFVEAGLAGAKLAAASLTGADFSGADLAGADLSGADLSEATVSDARGAGANFKGATLLKLRASGKTDLRQGKFGGVKAPESMWEGAMLDGADFSEAELPFALFESASLRKARFNQADLRKAEFRKAVLAGASLLRADLLQASLAGVDLDGADLSGANLYQVEFLGAKTKDTTFELANLKGTKLA